AELMGKLHDRLKDIGYEGHQLEIYLVRILFCLFAEDTGIFNPNIFQEYIEQRTSEDGSDLASKIQEIFQVLNTPKEKRFKNLDEQLNEFPYVNGKLYEENLPIASFDSKMRITLLECCHLDWSLISPAIFGSMFQSVMDKDSRRNLGAHYTSEKNILKLIQPLFLDELYEEFESINNNRNQLIEFHKKISKLKFLDPACGCGNFLIITYRELRKLEIEILKILSKNERITDIRSACLIDVDQMYGIEYEEFPARIAEVAMWLIDHQMNRKLEIDLGTYLLKLPLQKAANITNGNALQIDWKPLVKLRVFGNYLYDMGNKNSVPIEDTNNEFSFILGNPPFIGKSLQNQQQKEDLNNIFKDIKGAGTLDYVTCWFYKAAKYINNTKIKVAFVSTNSISQGEQVGILWNELFDKFNIKIHFAHRTFKWNNEAKGNAAVHVVIIGFASFDIKNKYIFEYDDIKGDPHQIEVKNINPYLVEGKEIVINSLSKPICNVPFISYGSMANDNGHLILNEDERNIMISKYPQSEKFIKPFLGSYEFINNVPRWCIWLKDIPPKEYSMIKEIIERIKLVKSYREKSTRETTRNLADFPMLFGEIRQPDTDYLLIPGVSSETRKYIPIGYLSKDVIASDSARTITNANKYLFGVLTSIMHMTWVKFVCGRLKSDYRYSNKIVYNNFPWPLDPSDKQKEKIESCAQKVLDIRKEFTDHSLADLYGTPMPENLIKAHNELDKAVDLAYRPQPFPSESKRMEFLFQLYEQYTADLFTKKKGKKNE
ncbi:MAG: class I SAM-dependent DNA methyltransferase, partial [Leptospiraceae bacterium]|nr:class I SAM-dependent DNA methyltransferase [Leptospiraceae bacterium]